MEIIKDTLHEAFSSAYEYVMWNHIMVETEDGELTYESEPITLIVNTPNVDKENLKLCSPYKDNFMKSYETALLYGSNSNFDYTYNERLFNYNEKINQIEYVINKLKQHLRTRRSLAITWYPEKDTSGEMSVPCLQYAQFHMIKNKLDMITVWRSRDILMGMPANIYAINTLHNYVVGQLRNNNIDVEIGKYIDISIVPHIYFKRDANFVKAMK